MLYGVEGKGASLVHHLFSPFSLPLFFFSGSFLLYPDQRRLRYSCYFQSSCLPRYLPKALFFFPPSSCSSIGTAVGYMYKTKQNKMKWTKMLLTPISPLDDHDDDIMVFLSFFLSFFLFARHHKYRHKHAHKHKLIPRPIS